MMGAAFFRPNAEFVIIVHTGDRQHSGTDSNVHLVLHDEKGNHSDPILLDNLLKNDLERGSVDTFCVPLDKTKLLLKHGNISCIEICSDNSGLGAEWFVDRIHVENKSCNKTFTFPVFRWIKGNKTYRINLLDTCLPQCEPLATIQQRQDELLEKRKHYQYDQKFPEKFPGGPVQIKTLPEDEEFSNSYKWDIQKQKIQLKVASKITMLTSGRWNSLDDLTNIYTKDVFTKPKGAYYWRDDLNFGLQRVARLNNCLIRLFTSIPEKFPVTDDLLKPVIDGLTINEAIAQKRLFICDLEILDGLPVKENKVLCAPIALFFVDMSKQLRPVAIQLFQIPGPNNPIFTPMCPPLTWTVVKMWYNCSDAAYHQALTHLGFTHLLIEGTAIAAHRNLSLSHPVFKLLAPHFLYVMNINKRALEVLVADGGWIDISMSYGNKGLFALVVKGFNQWRMDVDGTLPEDLKRRGVDDPNVLPSYHYRDDALLIYNAIKKYATSYLHLYYPKSEHLEKDTELQNWVTELVKERNFSEGGVGILGVPGNGNVTSIDQLIQIVTCIIFTCSVGHAAANFPQYDEYGFPPNYPAMMNGNPPTDTQASVTEKDILESLPDKSTTLDTMLITKVLSTKGTNSLGHFEVQYIFDPLAMPFVDEFHSDLMEISKIIKERNETRNPQYSYLDPEFIPNSISI